MHRPLPCWLVILIWFLDGVFINLRIGEKMKDMRKDHTLRTVPKSNRKIVVTKVKVKIGTLNTHINRSLTWLGQVVMLRKAWEYQIYQRVVNWRRTKNTMAKRKRTNNDLQNTMHRKPKIEQDEPYKKPEVNPGAPEGFQLQLPLYIWHSSCYSCNFMDGSLRFFWNGVIMHVFSFCEWNIKPEKQKQELEKKNRVIRGIPKRSAYNCSLSVLSKR